MKLLTSPALAILFFTLVSWACTGETKPQEGTTVKTEKAEDSNKFTRDQIAAQQKAWDRVMLIHDEVMPKMGTMNQLTKSLKTHWETNNDLEKAVKDEISIAIQELESADEGMWDWMHNLKQLKKLRDSETHESILKYLQEQEQNMILVREAMENSMENGERLLKEVGQLDS